MNTTTPQQKPKRKYSRKAWNTGPSFGSFIGSLVTGNEPVILYSGDYRIEISKKHHLTKP